MKQRACQQNREDITKEEASASELPAFKGCTTQFIFPTSDAAVQLSVRCAVLAASTHTYIHTNIAIQIHLPSYA